MKVKMLSAAALAGLLAASLTFATEPGNIGAIGQDSNSNSATQEGVTPTAPSGMSALNDASSNLENSSMDQGVSDTATGDDDY